MKKLETLGKVLSKNQQRLVFGGAEQVPNEGNKCNNACSSNSDCDTTCSSCEKNSNWDNQKFCVKP